MRSYLTFIFSAILVYTSLSLNAQYTINHLKNEDGLASDVITSIIQDKKGFIWFGTNNGLSKYDGYQFTTYKYSPWDTTTLTHSYVSALWEDQSGFIWVGTYEGGIWKFDPSAETFVRYYLNNPPSFVPKLKVVSAINEDKEGHLWIAGVYGELRRFNTKTGSFFEERYYLHPNSNKNGFDEINTIYKDSDDNIWFGGRFGLFRLDLEQDSAIKFTQVKIFKEYSYFYQPVVTSILEDHTGILWVGTSSGLYTYDTSTETITRQSEFEFDSPSDEFEAYVLSMEEDPYGNLWISFEGSGLHKIDKDRSGITSFYHHPNDPKSLSHNTVSTLMFDRTGKLWVGTQGGGVNILTEQKKVFNTLFPSQDFHSAVTALHKDSSGTLWIGTDGEGLIAFNKEKNSLTNFKNIPEDPSSIKGNNVRNMVDDQKGGLWIINNTQLSFFDFHSKKFTNSSGNADLDYLLKIVQITAMIQDDEGILWMGGNCNGLVRFDPKINTIKYYKHVPRDHDGISDYYVQAIFQDSKDNIWVGTPTASLNRLNKKTGKFSHFEHNPKDATSISSNIVNCFFEDKKGNLWIGTSFGGICKFDFASESFASFTEKDGLASNTIYGIVADDHGHLWLATERGLSKFSPVEKTFKNFDTYDGLSRNSFSTVYSDACVKGKDGTLYFGGSEGVTYFHPDDISLNEDIPPIALTQFSIFDQPQPGMHEADQITLDYDQNFFSFEFAALNYTNAHQNQYAYQLEGFDRDWIYSGTRRYASYTNLDPGTYTFRVKGSNNDGLWNEAGTSVQIVILPPWWQTWWAYTLYLILAAGLIYLGRQLTLKRERLKSELKLQKMEAEKMHEIDHMKSRFFANISHEFRTPLTLISSTAEKLEADDDDRPWRKQDYSLIQRYIHRLLSLINQLLDLSRLENNQLRVQKVSLEVRHFLQVLAASYTSLAESKGINYTYELPDHESWVLADEDKLEKVVINLLSNAFKFTPEGGSVHFSAEINLEHTVKAQPYSLQIQVKDSGIGMTEQEQEHIFERFYQADDSSSRGYEGAGIGLALTYEMLQLMQGEISVLSSPGQGSVFTVSLPLEQAQPIKPTHQNGTVRKKDSEITVPVREPEEALKSLEKPLLLLAEDNADLRAFIVHSLGAEYQVLEASNGAVAYQLTLTKLPELIISDVMMPEMDGISLCQELRTNPQTCHLPLIMLTARAGEENLLQGLEKGADAYLTKPFRMEELKLRISKLLELRRQLRERFMQQISLQPRNVEVSSGDAVFLEKLCRIMESRISESTLDVETLSHELGLSRVHLHRKLKQLSGQSPSEFIRNFRLERAAALLEKESGNISEVAFAVGFSSLTHFSKCFRKKYGMSPSAYMLSRSEVSGE